MSLKILKKNQKKLKTKLNKLLRDVVYLREGGRCERCGDTGVVEVHHPNKKQTIALRYYAPGCVLLCKWMCHPWAEAYPEEQKEWLINLKGQDLWDKLVELRNTYKMGLEESERSLNAIRKRL